MTRTAESVIPFPNGRGLVRITTGDDGTLVVSVEEAAQESGDARGANVYRSADGVTGYRGGSSVQYAPATSATTGTGSNTSSAVTWPTSAADPFVAAHPQTSANAIGEESAMLDLNVQLAGVTVQEKQAQLEIAKKEGADDAHLLLARLALQRAEIELMQAKIRQKRGSTSPARSAR